MQYRNVGGPWRRSDGTVIPRDGVFTPNAREVERMTTRRQIGIRFALVTPAAAEVAAVAAVAAVVAEVEDAVEDAVEEVAEVKEEVEDAVEEVAEVKEEVAETVKSRKRKAPEKWPLQMAPVLYLRVHPQGPRAELAQQHIDYEATNA